MIKVQLKRKTIMQAFGKKLGIDDKITPLEISQPTIGDNEMLVKVAAVGVGIHDEYFHDPAVNYPYVIGIEASGTIQKIGKNVEGHKPGDRIAFISMMQPKGGTWAEYAVVSDQSLILPIPEGMTFEQAAAVLVPANTSLKALAEVGLQPGDSLFIAGGAGAIGTLLIQLGKARGYKVVASASKKNHKLMRELGADYAVDYHDDGWQAQVKDFASGGVDAAIAIHPGTPSEVQSVVKDGGVLVAVSGDQLTPERSIILKGVFNNIDVKSELADFMNQVAKGTMKLIIGKIYPFSEAITALEQVKTRHTRGKLVLTMGAKTLQGVEEHLL